MSLKTETRHAGEFIVSEANGARSREAIVISSAVAAVLYAGTVLGMVAVDTADLTAAAVAGNTGNGGITLGDPEFAAGVKAGVYRITCIEAATDGGTFSVEDPDGVEIGVAEVGTEFDGEVVFTIADGGTDFAAGDAFTITVAEGSGKYVVYDPTNDDGSQTAAAILYEEADATSADADAVALVRDAEVNAEELTWFDGANAGQKATGLAELALKGVVGR
ncbi:head decoration protein [Minwuia thermotolerans]|uniref:Head decoration protein n=1 Tax=Minwuia thermotolerans TaxID=2056226 RepID=A0A2M9G2K1_9PROT|nr:head decoration protein [Minwuia thermotolerans]PJK29949.1 head decoration protein [Minwuia thermotolerans]